MTNNDDVCDTDDCVMVHGDIDEDAAYKRTRTDTAGMEQRN